MQLALVQNVYMYVLSLLKCVVCIRDLDRVGDTCWHSGDWTWNIVVESHHTTNWANHKAKRAVKYIGVRDVHGKSGVDGFSSCFLSNFHSVLLGRVKILPDTDLLEVLTDVRPKSQRRLCFQEDEGEDMKVALDKQGRILSCVRMKPRTKVCYLFMQLVSES